MLRFEGHFAGDTQTYRTKEEAEEWLARDPVAGFRAGSSLTESSRAGGAELEAAAHDEVAAALAVAKESPLPAPETAWEDVHA